MNTITLLAYAFSLLPSIVTGVEAVAGDVAKGADKFTMAKDALTAALTGAAAVLPAGSANATLANAAGAAASEVIDVTKSVVSIVEHIAKPNGALQVAYNLAKRTGALTAAKAK